jgi:hypothetical protein
LLHALGIDSAAMTDAQIAGRIAAMQRSMLHRVAKRRRCLPIELVRMPSEDLIEQIKIETQGRCPSREALPGILANYLSASTGNSWQTQTTSAT